MASIYDKNNWKIEDFVELFFMEDDKDESPDVGEFLFEMGDWCKTAEGFAPEEIESEGGEGQGEYAYTVFKVGDTYWKCEYSYWSHDGYQTDYAEVNRVEPFQKTVTDYKNI